VKRDTHKPRLLPLVALGGQALLRLLRGLEKLNALFLLLFDASLESGSGLLQARVDGLLHFLDASLQSGLLGFEGGNLSLLSLGVDL